MSVTSARVEVTDEPTALSAAETDDRSGQEVLVKNRGGATVDLGSDDVATGEGFELAAGDHITIGLQPGEQLFAVAATGTVRCDVLRTGA